MNSYNYILQNIKFFVLFEGNVVEGFEEYSDAVNYCYDIKRRFGKKLTIYSVNAAEDDKELERIREAFFYQMQEQEEEWDR